MKMKLQKKKNSEKSISVKSVDGEIELSHFQSIKQSLNWQSAEVNFGARMRVRDDSGEIKKGIKRLKELVEKSLAPVFHDQREVLIALGKDKESREK